MIYQQKKIKIDIFSFFALIFIAFHTIHFGYIDRLYNLEIGIINYINNKLIIYLFIFALPFVILKLFKIIYLNKFIFFFISWIFFSTLLSFIFSKTFSYSSEFSNTQRTVEQLGGFILGLVCGYYISRLNVDKSKIIVKAIKISIFLLFIGVLYQIFFLDDGMLYGRLHGASGEPKGLGIHLVPFIIAMLARFKLKINDFKKILTILACTALLILTKSSTALLSFGFMILVLIKIDGLLKIKFYKILIFLFILFIIIFSNSDLKMGLIDRIFIYLNAEYIKGVQSSFTFPIIGEIVVEANELPVILFFKDNPFLIITGVGLGQESIFSNKYIDQFGGIGFFMQDYGGYISPNFALLANTANFGLVMVMLLAIWAIALAHKLNNYLEGDKKFIFYFFLSHFLLTLLIFKTSIPISTSIIVLSSFIFQYKLLNVTKSNRN